MTETEKHPLPVVGTTPEKSFQTPAPVDAKPNKDELPPHLRPDATLSFMARNVSW